MDQVRVSLKCDQLWFKAQSFPIISNIGDAYMILDMGGGTTDIAVHAFKLPSQTPADGHQLREVVAGKF